MKSVLPRTVMVDDKTYEVMAIKQGGMGKVWLLQSAFDHAQDAIYRRHIAVKTFGGSEEREAIERELNIWISLQHECILPLRKIGRLDYGLAAIMPKMDGDLNDLIEATGPLPEKEVAKIVGRAVSALSYVWKNFRVLHLDLKPSNLLMDARGIGTVKVADWGISRIASGERNVLDVRGVGQRAGIPLHRTAYAAGTPLFMAPERFAPSWSMAPCIDIYSLGMMSIYLASGALPFSVLGLNAWTEIATGAYYENAKGLLRSKAPKFRDYCLGCIHPDPGARTREYDHVERRLKAI